MTELEKLDRYLTERRYPHIRNCLPYFDRTGTLITAEFNQILVYKYSDCNAHGDDPECKVAGARLTWDAVCYTGTIGSNEGKLEIIGDIVSYAAIRLGKGVEGNLTADDIIKRLEGYRRESN